MLDPCCGDCKLGDCALTKENGPASDASMGGLKS